MTDNVTAYPLCWPMAKPRTRAEQRAIGRFSRKESTSALRHDGSVYSFSRTKDLTMPVAVQRLERELDLLGAERIVLSTNVELRLDGTPRSDRRVPVDPGVACYFHLLGDPVVLACDRYTTVPDNIAAIAAHVGAMRLAERHGVGNLRELFRGFTALPPAMAVNDWRTVLGNPVTLADAERVYRSAILEAHPDRGGDEAKAAALNAAIAEARKALK